MNKVCPGCLARDSEIGFLRSMVHTYATNSAILMNETIIPKVQAPMNIPAPSVVNDHGAIVKMDKPEQPSLEPQYVDVMDVVNEVMGH